MKTDAGRFFTLLPYLGLSVALVLSTWAFIQSDRYRQETDEILNQTYEIQWRATQVRERLVRIQSYTRFADETGKLDPDINRQMALLSVNITQLLSLPYLERFFPQEEVKSLEEVKSTIEVDVEPIIAAGSNYPQARDYMNKLEHAMFEISSATVNHSATLQETAQIDIAASRNWFILFATRSTNCSAWKALAGSYQESTWHSRAQGRCCGGKATRTGGAVSIAD